MRQTVKNRMIKNVQMMAVGMMATASIMGTAAAMGVKMDNIPFNVLANPFQAVMTQGVAAIELGSSGSCGDNAIGEAEASDNATYELSMDGTLTISGTGVIGYNVFEGETNIKKVIINEGITEIQFKAFYNCSNLEEIQLPDSLNTITTRAFGYCDNLTSIKGGNNVNEVYQYAFEGSDYLSFIRTLIKSESESLNNYNWETDHRFATDNLDQYKVTSQITAKVQDDTLIFSGTGILDKGSSEYSKFFFDDHSEDIKKIIVEEGITEVKNLGLLNVEQVSLPDSVKQIGDNAFQRFTSLKTINLPEGLEQIGRNAFMGCQELTEIYIPIKITEIKAGTFEQCNKLTKIQGMQNISQIYRRQFTASGIYNSRNPLETTLETTNGYVLGYDWLTNESRKIKAPETPECGPDATYEEDDGKLTITGSGSIDDEAFKDKDTVTEVVIDEGITEIGDQSFENMDNLETVIIPDSVTNIGDQAFAENPKLEIVQGGDNADIADNAFDCTEPETTIKTDNENIYNNIKDNTDRDVQLQNSVPISPVEENWLYSSDDEAFITDKVQVGSVKDDFESLLDEFATVVGLDEKQGAKQNYETADASNEDTLVYCTKASDWIITIPKDLVMSGDDESRAEYVVGIYGNVDPAKRVTVTPAPSFEMTNTGNAKVKYNAQVNQAVTGINGMDIIESPEADVDDASQMSGTITANLKRAGSYRGTMTFTVDYVDHT